MTPEDKELVERLEVELCATIDRCGTSMALQKANAQRAKAAAAIRRLAGEVEELTRALNILPKEIIKDVEAHVRGKTIEGEGTYKPPAHGWTCFHCGETFKTTEVARLHFGDTPQTTAALQSQLSEARELLEHIADLETFEGWADKLPPCFIVSVRCFLSRTTPIEQPEKAGKQALEAQEG